MVVFPRALRLSLLLALLFAAPSTLDAQSKAIAPRESATTSSVFQKPGWLYEGSDITPDPDWYFGTLPNGLRYAARRNSVPQGPVSIRVRIDAGLMADSDTERGVARLTGPLPYHGARRVAHGRGGRPRRR